MSEKAEHWLEEITNIGRTLTVLRCMGCGWTIRESDRELAWAAGEYHLQNPHIHFIVGLGDDGKSVRINQLGHLVYAGTEGRQVKKGEIIGHVGKTGPSPEGATHFKAVKEAPMPEIKEVAILVNFKDGTQRLIQIEHGDLLASEEKYSIGLGDYLHKFEIDQIEAYASYHKPAHIAQALDALKPPTPGSEHLE